MSREKKVCGKQCDIFSRIVGYYRNISNWNIGKKKEFSERVTFRILPKEELKDDQNKGN